MRTSHPRQTIALLLIGVVAFQIAQGLAYQRRITPYKSSYWLVTYEFGFSRRGLAGELLRRLAGTAPSAATIEVVQYGVTTVLLVLLCLLVRAALRSGGGAPRLSAIALCCSPFVFDFAAFQRRPDQVGYIAVLLIGFGLWRYPLRRTWTALVAGLLLAFSVAVSDSAFLGCTGWVVVLLLLVPGETLRSVRTWARLLLIAVPPAVLALLSATAGRLSDSQVRSLAATAKGYGWSDVVVFPYLSDNLRDSVERVGGMPRTAMVGSIAVGVLLLALQGWLMYGFRNPSLLRAALRAPGLTAAIAACIIGLIALLALGIDWFRWISGFGLMGTVAATFGLLMRVPKEQPTSLDLPGIRTAAVALYLAAVAAFPNMISMSEGLLQLLLAYNSAAP